jgi:hypothetical protein
MISTMRTLFSSTVYAAQRTVTSLSDLRHFASYAESSARIVRGSPQQFASLPGSGVILPEMEKSISIMDVLDRGQRKCQNRNRLSSDTTPKAGTTAISLSRATSGRASAASSRSIRPAVRSFELQWQTRGRRHDPRTGRGDGHTAVQRVHDQAASRPLVRQDAKGLGIHAAMAHRHWAEMLQGSRTRNHPRVRPYSCCQAIRSESQSRRAIHVLPVACSNRMVRKPCELRMGQRVQASRGIRQAKTRAI